MTSRIKQASPKRNKIGNLILYFLTFNILPILARLFERNRTMNEVANHDFPDFDLYSRGIPPRYKCGWSKYSESREPELGTYDPPQELNIIFPKDGSNISVQYHLFTEPGILGFSTFIGFSLSNFSTIFCGRIEVELWWRFCSFWFVIGFGHCWSLFFCLFEAVLFNLVWPTVFFSFVSFLLRLTFSVCRVMSRMVSARAFFFKTK